MTEDEALTAVLVAEHAAIYAYGVLGARLDDRTRPAALRAYDVHRASRDALADLLRAANQDVPAPSAGYDVTVTGRPAALQLAVRVETEVGVRWRDLVASSSAPAVRQLAVPALQACAVQATQWRLAAGITPATTALPGTV